MNLTAQVCYFEEFKSWAVTLYDAEGNRAVDEDGREIEAEWYHLKVDAVGRAEALFQARKVDTVETFTKLNMQSTTWARVRVRTRT